MANPTTNYGWPMPTSVDLVTDLPTDFDAFGQPVDNTLKALNPETTLGDISYRSAVSNTNTRLAIGTAGQVLSVSAGVPAWTTTADVTPLTTKGDVFTFSTVDARIGVGANDTVLTADSSEATGLKWAAAAAPSSNWTLISSGAVTSGTTASFAVSGYDRYILHFNAYIASTPTVKFRFNALSSLNYRYGAFMSGAVTTQTDVDGINLDNFSSFNDQPCGFLEINNANTGTKPQFFGSWRRANTANDNLINYSGIYNDNITLSSIDLASTQTIGEFSYRIWGL